MCNFAADMLKRFLTALAAAAIFVTPQARETGPVSALMPMPASVVSTKGAALRAVASPPTVSSLPSRHRLLDLYGDIMTKHFGEGMGVKTRLEVDPSMSGKEHYRLEVSSSGLHLTGASEEALFRGMQTLDQLLWGDVASTARGEIAPVVIDDSPAFRAGRLCSILPGILSP